MNGYLGVDVGGSRKGLHVAFIGLGESSVGHLCNAADAKAIAEWLGRNGLMPAVVAIDCPPRSQRSGPITRLAERQLHRRGYRIQWTRAEGNDAAEWMRNGERLWTELRELYPSATLIETFPRVAAPNLANCPISLPLWLLAPHHNRPEWKDFVDACICADVARRYEAGEASYVGVDDKTGEVDEFGFIYY